MLDPFAGSGTTLEVAEKLGRKYRHRLNPDYCELLRERNEVCTTGLLGALG